MQNFPEVYKLSYYISFFPNMNSVREQKGTIKTMSYSKLIAKYIGLFCHSCSQIIKWQKSWNSHINNHISSVITKNKNSWDILLRHDPFERFSLHVWQNTHVNTVRCAIVCHVYFSFPKILGFCNFIIPPLQNCFLPSSSSWFVINEFFYL